VSGITLHRRTKPTQKPSSSFLLLLLPGYFALCLFSLAISYSASVGVGSFFSVATQGDVYFSSVHRLFRFVSS
jgi:hypothetical protein